MKKWIIFSAMALAIQVLSPAAQGQSVSPEERRQLLLQAQARIQELVGLIRPKLARTLSASERAIYDEIRFIVPFTDDPRRAQAVNDGGRKTIELSVGFGRSVEMMADAEVLDSLRDDPVVCEYVHYIVTQIRTARSQGLSPGFIKGPEDFLRMTDTQKRKYWDDEQKQTESQAITANALGFVLAHEIAHHVLRHLEGSRSDDLTVRRQQEADADAWALRHCVTAHFSPLGGIVPLLFDYYSTQHPIANESKRDHPADILRIRKMFAGMIDALPQFRADVEAKGQSYDTFRASIVRQLHDIDEQASRDN